MHRLRNLYHGQELIAVAGLSPRGFQKLLREIGLWARSKRSEGWLIFGRVVV
jgi:hypothetical protein